MVDQTVDQRADGDGEVDRGCFVLDGVEANVPGIKITR